MQPRETPEQEAKYQVDAKRAHDMCRQRGALIADGLYAQFGRTGLPAGYLESDVDPFVDGALADLQPECDLPDSDITEVKRRMILYCLERMQVLCLPPAGSA